MNLITIIILLAIFIFGIIEMRKSSSILKSPWFKKLSYNDKIKFTSKVKDNWKVTIILLAIIVCAIFIVGSSFISKVHNYDMIVNIAMIITGIIDFCIILYNNDKFKKEISNFRD